MPYGKLLYRELEKKGMSVSEFAKALNKNHSYISKIINGRINPPSEKINEQIAKILECDIGILKLEAYYDKAPKEVKHILNTFMEATLKGMFAIGESNSEKFSEFNVDEEVKKYSEELKQEPISMVLMGIITDSNAIVKATEEVGELIKIEEVDEDGFKATLTMKEPLGTTVTDNGMAPKILKDSRIKPEIKEKYSDGDIVCIKGEKGIIVRELKIENGYYKFMPYNLNEYSPKIYSREDGEKLILSKVIEVTTKL